MPRVYLDIVLDNKKASNTFRGPESGVRNCTEKEAALCFLVQSPQGNKEVVCLEQGPKGNRHPEKLYPISDVLAQRCTRSIIFFAMYTSLPSEEK